IPYLNHIEQCTANLAKQVTLGIDAFVNTRCRIDQPAERAVPEGANIKFNRLDLTLHFPYVMYLSFSIDQKGVEYAGQAASSENKKQLEFHLAGYSFVIVRKDTMSTGGNMTNSHIVAAETYSAEQGAIDHLFTRAFHWAKELLTIIRNTNNILLPTVEQLLEFESITNCEYCNAEFTNSGNTTRKFSHRVPWDYQSWDENMIDVISTSDEDIYEARAAWGSLEPDHGSQPKHIRKVQLARFDPNKPPKAPKLAATKSKLSPNDPDFWTTSDVFILDDEQQYFAKKVYNEASRCMFLHIGKQNPKSIQRIRFT
ncbi:unnamed protein product, partial [Allacma fusca]